MKDVFVMFVKKNSQVIQVKVDLERFDEFNSF